MLYYCNTYSVKVLQFLIFRNITIFRKKKQELFHNPDKNSRDPDPLLRLIFCTWITTMMRTKQSKKVSKS